MRCIGTWNADRATTDADAPTWQDTTRGTSLIQAATLPQESRLPRVSPLMLAGFQWYARSYVRRHFDSVRLRNHGNVPTQGPVVVYLNHASWWDPLICLVLAEHITPGRRAYAPIDAHALAKYRFFGRIGFFGVERGRLAGVRAFLQVGSAILADPTAALWVTPQGRFADPRERPIRMEPGIAELVTRVPDTACVPLALEYPFWTERTPEALAAVGPTITAPHGVTRREIASMLETGLASTMDALRDAALAQSPSQFETVLSGVAGVGGVYDLLKFAMAKLRGRRFDARHRSDDLP